MKRTWPSDWAERKSGRDCPMCLEGRPDDNGHGVRIFAGARSDSYLQRAGLRGYTVAIWRGDHVADPTELPDGEAMSYWSEVLRVARALDDHYRPAKLNFLVLGNTVPHLHTHISPRYVDDPAPGRPLDPADNRERLPEDEFARDVSALRELLERK
jgi:diadenosine tetraphosphate (Ap4A) HIT family hydrolase